MKYVEASKFGGPEVLAIAERETPKPKPGELLLEVQAAGVNYADVAARSGFYPALKQAPFPMIEKNISLIGFNLGGHLESAPHAVGELFRFVNDGSIKVEVTKYPLDQASHVHALFESRQTAGKLILVP